MGKSQRTKGAVFEREVARFFSERLGCDFKRNIGQARDGGNDIDVGPLVIECKRRKSLKTIEGWLDQADRAAMARSLAHVPVVVARSDDNSAFVILSLDDFYILAAPEIRRALAGRPFRRASEAPGPYAL